jgi:hypothetical protein
MKNPETQNETKAETQSKDGQQANTQQTKPDTKPAEKQTLRQYMLDLFAKMDAVNPADVPEPKDRIAFGEKYVGILPDSLKGAYKVYSEITDALSEQCKTFHESAMRMMMDAMLMGNKPDQMPAEEKALLAEHDMLHKRAGLSSRIFWQAVREAFPEILFNDETIGLRKGWRVVICATERQRSIQGGTIVVSGMDNLPDAIGEILADILAQMM